MPSSLRPYLLLCSVMMLLAAATAARSPQTQADTVDGQTAEAANSAAAAKLASEQYHDNFIINMYRKYKAKHSKHGYGHKEPQHGEEYYETDEPSYNYYKPEEYDPEEDPEYYKNKGGPDPYLYPDSSYYEGYKKYGSYDANAEPGTHRGDTHWKHKVTINGTEKCDFNDKDTFKVCLQEVRRTPAGAVASTETGVTEFTSYFGCCPKLYSPYKTTSGEIEVVGNCVWTVTADPAGRSAVHLGVKMGSVTALCTVTAESKCLYPLKVGATFEVSADAPGPGTWKRISAAIPDEDDPDYTIYISSAARAKAQALSTDDADQAAQRESGTIAQVAAAAEGDDDSYDRYGGEGRSHRERRDSEGRRYIDERQGSDEDGPGDRYRSGGRGYRQYDDDEESSYDGRHGRREHDDDDDDSGYETEYGVTASAGRADIYKGPLSNFAGIGSEELKCGKVEFTASFVDEDGTVRCPAQTDNSNVGKFNATTVEGRDSVPVIECGSYEMTLVKKRVYKEHNSYGGYKAGY